MLTGDDASQSAVKKKKELDEWWCSKTVVEWR